MKIVEIVRDHPITKGSVLDGEVIGHQLIFTNESRESLQGYIDHPEWKIRWIPQVIGDEQATVRAFEKKFGVKCTWGEADDRTGRKWPCYIIEEN